MIQNKVKEYEDFIWELFNPEIKKDREESIFYLVGKLVNELTEVVEPHTLNIEKGDDETREMLIDECGDVLWYITNLYRVVAEKPLSQHEYVRDGYVPALFNINLLDPYDQMLFTSGQVLGSLLKHRYHGKTISWDFAEHLEVILTAYLQFLNDEDITLSEIIEHNSAKLGSRHGKGYNKSFYNKS